MQKIVLLSLLAVVLVGVESHFGNEESFKKYATMKIFEDCYGKDTVKEWYHEVKEACSKCRNHSDKSSSSAFVYMMDMFKRYQMRIQQQQYQKSPSYQAFAIFGHDMAGQQKPYMMPQQYDPLYANRFPTYNRYASNMYQQYPFYPHYDQAMRFRQTRAAEDKKAPSKVKTVATTQKPKEQPKEQTKEHMEEQHKEQHKEQMKVEMFDKHDETMTENPLDAVPHKIRQMIEELQNQIGNTTCIMKELKFLDDENRPNYESIKKRVEMMLISEEVKADLYRGVDYCNKVSTCLPEDEYSGMMKTIAQPMAFFKCFQGKKLETCMKKDLRERFGEFFDDEMMMMSRTFMSSGDKKSDNADNIFDMIYGFESSEMRSFF